MHTLPHLGYRISMTWRASATSDARAVRARNASPACTTRWTSTNAISLALAPIPASCAAGGISATRAIRSRRTGRLGFRNEAAQTPAASDEAEVPDGRIARWVPSSSAKNPGENHAILDDGDNARLEPIDAIAEPVLTHNTFARPIFGFVGARPSQSYRTRGLREPMAKINDDAAEKNKHRNAGLKAAEKKVELYGEAELSRAARMAVWSKRHGKGNPENPYTRENFYLQKPEKISATTRR